MEGINVEVVTVEDLIDAYEKKGMAAVICAGKLVGFVKEGDSEDGE